MRFKSYNIKIICRYKHNRHNKEYGIQTNVAAFFMCRKYTGIVNVTFYCEIIKYEAACEDVLHIQLCHLLRYLYQKFMGNLSCVEA